MSDQKQPDKPRLIGAPRSWLEWALQVAATGVFTAGVAYFTEFSNGLLALVFVGSSAGTAFSLWREQKAHVDE
ncbi:hypothetical protein KO498_05445 [Lentibacter algarum]|uniref:hypothetical protein n=1 Tax=Lentibacter algarum TaxID=576131 RepID=UPI001C0683D8|nr:hypothetical protein [Lentibacter algarum]MBU2981252.1 hypothetical protein [Lentibacter algarum]